MDMSLSQNKKFYFYSSLSVFWFLLIVYLMVFYRSKANDISYEYADKIIHFILFFVQSYLVTKAYLVKNKILNFSILKIILPFIGFCVSVEVIQIYIPYRSYESVDLLMNFIGSFVGSIIGYFFSK
ncbi:MAG: VanZ family protein [Flammeovirgaceae bacterium]|jgi:VanZ family protein